MPRIAEPRNERSRRTRAALLDAAWVLLEEGGAERLSLEEVAAHAGVTRRAIYLHFTSRAELLLALMAHMDSSLGLEESVASVVEASGGLATMRAWAAHLARYHPRILNVIRAVDQARRTDEDAAAVWRHAMEKWHAGCREIARRLAAENGLSEPWTEETAADMLWALMSVHLLEALTEQRGWSAEQYGERLFIAAARALTAPTPNAAPAAGRRGSLSVPVPSSPDRRQR